MASSSRHLPHVCQHWFRRVRALENCCMCSQVLSRMEERFISFIQANGLSVFHCMFIKHWKLQKHEHVSCRGYLTVREAAKYKYTEFVCCLLAQSEDSRNCRRNQVGSLVRRGNESGRRVAAIWYKERIQRLFWFSKLLPSLTHKLKWKISLPVSNLSRSLVFKCGKGR